MLVSARFGLAFMTAYACLWVPRAAELEVGQSKYLTEQQIGDFHRDGYLLIHNFLTDKELNDYTESFRRMIQASLRKAAKHHAWLDPGAFSGNEFDAGLNALEKADHAYVASIYDSIPQMPAFLRLVAKYETQQVVNELLGKPQHNSLNTYTARTLFAPPGDERRTYTWHQEVFYTTPHAQFIQTWAPLVRDVEKPDGAIWLMPRSHHQIHNSTWSQPEGRALQIVIDDSVLSQFEPIQLPMKLGSMLFFSGKLIHKSGRNSGPRHRFSVVSIYHDLDAEDYFPPRYRIQESPIKQMTRLQYFIELLGKERVLVKEDDEAGHAPKCSPVV